MDIKLAYGIRDGRVVLVSELEKTENGEKCNCTCPECGGILIAKLGEKRRRHFAHKTACDCDDEHAQETGVHLLAKEIIRENRRIYVPGFDIAWHEIVPKDIDISVAAQVNIELPHMNGRLVEYDSVEIEKSIDDIVADAVIKVGGISCIVEVAVTHYIDEAKTKKLEEIGLSALEIDLNDLWKNSPTRDDVVAAVLSDETNRHWAFNPLREQRLREKKNEFQKKYDAEELKQEQNEIRKLAYRQTNIYALQEMMKPENYASELNRLRNDKQATGWLKYFDFSKMLPEYPFYMDIPITGECVFSCDRRVWQGKLFDDYVYKGFGADLYSFSIGEIKKRVDKWNGQIQYDKRKAYRTTVYINGLEQEISFSYDVVQRYFYYLELLGFVYRVGYKLYSERPVSLDPPNSLIAGILNDILKSVDCSSPNINQIIKSELLSRLSGKEKNFVLERDVECD